MFPNLYGPIGLIGWLLILTLWLGLIAGVVWAIARLFPSSTKPRDSARPDRGAAARQARDAASARWTPTNQHDHGAAARQAADDAAPGVRDHQEPPTMRAGLPARRR